MIGYAVAFLAGAAAVLAFAPIGFYPIELVSFAILIHLWQHASRRRAFWIGFAFGLGLFGTGVSWVFVSLSEFGGMPAPVAAFATLCFCALLSAFTGFAGWLQARIPASDAARACLVIPACWTLGEWLRSWVLTGFPWLSAGYAATGWPTQGFAPVAGVLGISFVTLSLAGLAWVILVEKETRLAATILFLAVVLLSTLGVIGISVAALLLIGTAWRMARMRKMLVAAISLFAIIMLGEALQKIEWTEPLGAPVPTALLQGNIAQDLKFQPGRYAQTLETYGRLAEGSSAKIIVFPETALPRLYGDIEPSYIERLESVARRNGGDLLLGVPYRDSGGYYNSVMVLGSSGRQVYHKNHLVPFGEFVPPAFGWVMRMLRIPMSDFSRGALDQRPLAAAGQSVALSVCYEDAFGDALGERAAQATLLVNVSNVAWFGDSLAPAQHLQIARLRAIESGRMHLAATNTGVTAAIDRDGRVLARLPQFEEGRLEIAAQGYTGLTPYLRFADLPILFLALSILVAHIVVARLRPNR